MPTELESGRLQLDAEARRRYAKAAGHLALNYLDLHAPLSRDDFISLHLAYCMLNGDVETLNRVEQLATEELARRRNRQ
ncbi:MAG: hypothetical protein V4568_08405 [Pseudomonadota bacterium]